MRILLTHTSTLPDRMGGSERVMWHLARGLAARGHDVRIVARQTTPGAAASTIDGVTITRYRDPLHSFAALYLTSLRAARLALRPVIRDWRPDVVHAHHSLTGLGASAAGARRLCYTFYGPWHLEFLQEVLNRSEMPALKRWTRPLWAPAKAALARRLEGAALGRSGRIVALSTYSVRQLAEIHGVPNERVVVIPGGVDLARFAPTLDRAAARRGLGLPPDGALLFTVRRLVPRMGLEALLRAVDKLPDARLVIGGAGWLRPRLERTTAALGLGDRVRFVGFVADEDLPRYYQAADLVVLPSASLEGFGLITLEALACGTPVVATPQSGTVDVLELLEPGWIAADATPESLASTISTTLERVAGAPDAPARCRALAAQYSWERMVDRHETLYRSLA